MTVTDVFSPVANRRGNGGDGDAEVGVGGVLEDVHSAI